MISTTMSPTPSNSTMRKTYHTQLHIHGWANLVNEDKYTDRNGFHTNEKRKFEFMLVIDR